MSLELVLNQAEINDFSALSSCLRGASLRRLGAHYRIIVAPDDSWSYTSFAPSSLSRPVSPATLDEHEADTLREHVFVNVLSPSWSVVAP